MKGFSLDPSLTTTMFSRAGTIRHGRLYSDRRQEKRKNKSEQKLQDKKQKIETQHNIKGYSPFNTVSRDTRNSFLLRVTHEPNVKTIYRPNFDFGKNIGTQFTFQKQKCVRKISNIQMDPELIECYNTEIKSQCSQKLNQGRNTTSLLITKDCNNWRKSHHQIDFNKQVLYKQQKSMTSTNFHTTHSSPKTTSQRQNKAHKFQSYSPHKYLVPKPDQKKRDVFNATDVNWGIVKKNWNTRGLTPFSTYAQKIINRQDRIQPQWNTKLNYNPNIQKIKPKINSSLSFTQYTNRAQQTGKYPMRLSQRKDYGQSKYNQLKNIITAQK